MTIFKILFLAANPTDTTRLRLDEESRAIDNALRSSEHRENFVVQQHWAVRVSDIQGLFLRHEPNIVHFSGHGSHLGEIFLEDDRGKAQTVSTIALSRLFSLFSDSIKCVVLNACFSEPQAQCIAEYIDYVIGMTSQIGDKSAIRFAASFYQALGYGKDVPTAFKLGCLEIELHGLGEGETPKLIVAKPNLQEPKRSKSTAFVDEFLDPLESLKKEDIDLSREYIEMRNKHWDDFQRRVDGLDEDSKFEVQKFNSLYYLGKYSLTVAQLKNKLAQLGHYRGKIDSVFSKDLADALVDFQKINNLRHADGVFGPLTYQAMAEKMKGMPPKESS